MGSEMCIRDRKQAIEKAKSFGFDLQGAVAKVKAAFGHLNTLKIAVMGCVVNGPGEMGDADYGYVGAGNGKVNLYKGRKMVRTAVPEEEAIGALREMIEGRS